MESNWIKVSSSLREGLTVINALEETKFEQFLKRIVMKLKAQETDNIFSEDETQKLEKIFKVESDQLLLAIKTILYLFKKIFKYIFMPSYLKNDLINIGLNEEKVDIFVKIWSAETSKTLSDLTSKGEQFDDNPDFSWKLNAEISSIYHKKCKVPKAYLKIDSARNDLEVELTHPELQSIFLQIESIQNELYGTLIGNERVTSDQTVEMLLQDIKSRSSDNSHVYIPEDLKSYFRSQRDLPKDMMGQCLLFALTFMDLCIYKNKDKIEKLLSKKVE